MMTIDPAQYLTQLCQMMLDVSAISIFASVWTAFVFLTSGNWRKSPHSQTFVIVIAQAFISVGALLSSQTTGQEAESWLVKIIQYGIFVFGMYASR